MAVFTGLGSAASPSITFSSDTDTGIFSPGANQLAVATNGAQRVSIDSSGRLLVGISTSVSQNIANGTVTPQLQNASTNQSGSTISSVNYNSGGNPATLALGSSTGGTLATQGVVNNDGKLGHIVFTGSDGTTFLTAAEITAEVDGTPGTDDMPGRLVFRTTADGSASPTERLRIDSSGRLLVGTSIALTNTYVSGTAIAPVAQIEATLDLLVHCLLLAKQAQQQTLSCSEALLALRLRLTTLLDRLISTVSMAQTLDPPHKLPPK